MQNLFVAWANKNLSFFFLNHLIFAQLLPYYIICCYTIKLTTYQTNYKDFGLTEMNGPFMCQLPTLYDK